MAPGAAAIVVLAVAAVVMLLSLSLGWRGVVPLGRSISTRIFQPSFHQQECDVVDLIRASGKFFNPHKKVSFQRSCSRVALRPDQMAQSLFAKLFFGAILRVGKAVGIHYQDVARMECELSVSLGDPPV
jgi:hypothetical protein